VRVKNIWLECECYLALVPEDVAWEDLIHEVHLAGVVLKRHNKARPS
jgi:hypothetical protein